MLLEGKKIYVRFIQECDTQALLDLYTRNRELFQEHSPTYSDEDFTLESKSKEVKAMKDLREKDRVYSFGVFLYENHELIGDVTLFNIFRGPLQKCLIGYVMDKKHNGHGYMSEAVALVVKYGFEELKIHRIEAGAMLDNIGSMRVLEKAGFHKEGIEKQGVKINGQWEDHQIYAIISDIDI